MSAMPKMAGTPVADLLAGLTRQPPAGEVTGVASDSRNVSPGSMFIACAGERTHGLDHLPEAIARGASVVVWEPVPGVETPALPAGVGSIDIPGLRRELGLIASRFYKVPSAALRIAGVTGTNGKTSTCHLLASALTALDIDCGVIGTLGAGRPGKLVAGAHTTPDAVALHGLLAGLRDSGARAVAMEVSSHALDQHRVAAVRFDVAAFTNLSRDHLDYHGDFAAYGRAKAQLFSRPGLRHAVINTGDAFGRGLLRDMPSGIDTVRIGSGAMKAQGRHRALMATGVSTTPRGLALDIDGDWGAARCETRLLGSFNVENVLCALAVMLLWKQPLDRAVAALAGAAPAPGRMETFGGGDRPLVVVDYAHTPDALTQALTAIRSHTAGSVWCVFGCGGERDAGKRPLMGAAAAARADHIVLTDDNPRGEDGEAIISRIRGGIGSGVGDLIVERDRRAAIGIAIASAAAGDVVLVAGKGHETTQHAGTDTRPFDDRTEVTRLLAEVRR